MFKNWLILILSITLTLFALPTWTIPEGNINEQLMRNQLFDTIEQLHKSHQLQNNVNQVNYSAARQQQNLQQQRHQKSYDKNDDVVFSLYNKNNITSRIDGMQKQQQWEYSGDNSLNTLVKNKRINKLKIFRKRRELSDWFIAPNTRWCGRGNTANGTYNHLGGASSADKCCRKHDHCQIFIPAMSSRYELFNYRPYTLSHCNCDRRFRTCLKMSNDDDANAIGKLFFNMVQTQCFVLRSEKICQKRASDGSCDQELLKYKAYLKNNKRF